MALATARLAASLRRLGWFKSVKYAVLGKEANQGLLFKGFVYVLLASTAYIFLHPILYMLSTMLKSDSDLLSPSVIWIPTGAYLGNLAEAWDVLKYNQSFLMSASIAGLSALLHSLSCAVGGYAFARLEFPFKRFWYVCLLLAFIIPPQVTVLPTIFGYHQLGMSNSPLTLLLPALFGHGVKGALFIIIFRQFFLTQPKELEEAARIDGAGAFRIFGRVLFPLAKPAILVVFLFSVVWTWNDFYMPSMFLAGAADVPLAAQMARLGGLLDQMSKEQGLSPVFFEPIKMAASFLVIVPLIVLYMFAQRAFVESADRTGMVE